MDLLLGGGGFQLPWYAPELNPVELLWAHAKKRLANRAIEDPITKASKAVVTWTSTSMPTR
ncbi:hypothetical protein ABT150_02145 [Streptomyces mirabilis]|uniref:hypothetical protein n=1 Tax=Streptomyces mirabilis TaxID=68239 RepID=UPI00332006FA